MAQTWLNPDGLYKKYGVTKTTANTGGEYVTTGALREIEVNIPDLTALATGSSILSDVVFTPKMRIEEVEIVTTTAVTSGGSAVLNVGLVQTDRSTAIDVDGLVEALAIASFNAAGEKVVLRPGATSAGALIGTTPSAVGYLVADYDTAAFTAGAITIRIRYRAVV